MDFSIDTSSILTSIAELTSSFTRRQQQVATADAGFDSQQEQALTSLHGDHDGLRNYRLIGRVALFDQANAILLLEDFLDDHNTTTKTTTTTTMTTTIRVDTHVVSYDMARFNVLATTTGEWVHVMGPLDVDQHGLIVRAVLVWHAGAVDIQRLRAATKAMISRRQRPIGITSA
ncbi:hypothetical protein V1514DRAFT_281594 [Lipomyces japonicus]|uniref:uncharacterized protein n=1 Tax=Lipomyces japonicus TaxID=56871 RepID=UPI0034CD1AD4